MRRNIPVTRPYFDESEIKEVSDSIRSGWVVQGPKVKAFEEKIARFVGSKYAVATNSCTTALHLSLLTLGIGLGDEVIVPSFTFIATPNSVVYTGATPVFTDIEESTYNIDPKSIDKKITRRTKAIMPVHQAGLPADMMAIRRIAKKHRLKIIEDAACGLGASIDGKRVGSFGDIGCFSFHPRKVITCGEGGMVVTDNKALAEKARILRSHGASVSDRKRHESKKFIDEKYHVLGYNYRLSDIHAAIGLAQIKKLRFVIMRRQSLAKRYNKAFLKNSNIIPPCEPDRYKHTYQSYLIKLSQKIKISRDQLLQLLKERNISARIGVKATHLEPYYVRKGRVNLPVTEKVARQIITLPLYPQMTFKEQDYVIDCLLEIVGK